MIAECLAAICLLAEQAKITARFDRPAALAANLLIGHSGLRHKHRFEARGWQAERLILSETNTSLPHPYECELTPGNSNIN
jgi:hypothetical protein